YATGNLISGAVTAPVLISGAASNCFVDGYWQTYTPTVTATAGTFTNVSATGSYAVYQEIVVFQMTISIITNGTAANAVLATLPLTAASQNFAFSGYNTGTGNLL